MEGSHIRNRRNRPNMAHPHPPVASSSEGRDKYAEMTESYLKTHFQPDSNLLTKFQIKKEEFGVLNATLLKRTLEALINEVDDYQINSEEIPIRLQIRFCRSKALICEHNRARAKRWEENGFQLDKDALADRFDREDLLVCALRVEHRLLMHLYTCGDNPIRRQGIIDNLQRYRQQIRDSGQPWGRCPAIVEARRDLRPRGTSSNTPRDEDTAEDRDFVIPPSAAPILCQTSTHRRYYRPPGQCKLCREERWARQETLRRRLRQMNQNIDQYSRINQALRRIA